MFARVSPSYACMCAPVCVFLGPNEKKLGEFRLSVLSWHALFLSCALHAGYREFRAPFFAFRNFKVSKTFYPPPKRYYNSKTDKQIKAANDDEEPFKDH